MTALPAPVWNQIAETQELETPAAKLAFRLNPDQLARMDDAWAKLEKESGTPENLILPLLTCLPILAESEAVAAHLSRHPALRSALPEMNSPQEAADLMQAEWKLTDDEKRTLTAALSSPGARDRWRKAAQNISAA